MESSRATKQPPHLVDLTSVKDSKILRVNVYSGLAEVAREFTLDLRQGDNKVVISGLPTVVVKESLRVEGHGSCVIHDVSLSETPLPSTPKTSAKLEELLAKSAATDKAITRCQRSIDALSSFQSSVAVETLEPAKLHAAHTSMERVAQELDDKLIDLEGEKRQTYAQINKERLSLAQSVDSGDMASPGLRQRVSINLYSDKGGEVKLIITYGVSNAGWNAGYDVYVKTDTKEKPVSLLYKASIFQSTGEVWEDVPLTLETVRPTFGISIPDLPPWTLSIYQPPPYLSLTKSSALGGGLEKKKAKKSRKRQILKESESSSTCEEAEEVGEMDLDGYGAPGGNAVGRRKLFVSSKSNIVASFSVPGIMTVPSDGDGHNVTITELKLGATMSWICVPRKLAKVHLSVRNNVILLDGVHDDETFATKLSQAKILNDSEFNLLKGPASIYVDGSFISRSELPGVSPQETFDCALGVDPAIRIVYHPRSKKVSRSGFPRKTTSTYTFEQRISITNNKADAISGLKILDQVPLSENETIAINMLNPALILSKPSKKGPMKTPEAVTVSQGVVAHWTRADEPETDPSLWGKDGMLNWTCSVPAQGKVNLSLLWEVVCPIDTQVEALDN
ncbi:hypothetical protein BJ165DRAFT_768589 [Panaeolus papilionaceus]|nr:hypothetical protein BJ165DRAFT_768589 [Panaeolus papilionaceus]